MKKLVIIAVVVIAALTGVAFYSGMFARDGAEAANGQAQGAAGGNAAGGQGQGGQGQGAPGGGGQFGGGRGGGRGGRFGGPTGPMTVEVATVRKAPITQQLTVVGNLIGDATVAVVPKAAGRLQEVYVRLGDRVSRGQRVAKIEDQEIQEQVKQAQAAFEVSRATIRQRDADLALAMTNVERSRNLFERQLLPKQTLDDNEARYQSAVAQLDLARAQNTQSQARLDELKINLQNTNIVSPVDGFVARRAVDPGAFVGNNAPVVDVVDIRRLRLVVNVVEKDLKQIKDGDTANVNVDAFPGETFVGRIARLSPIVDPTTRTSPIEIEIPNPGYRLKPGMYARVNIVTGSQKESLIVPTNALLDLGGRRGVFLATQAGTATFRPVRTGIEDDAITEVLDGVVEGDVVVTTGSGALTDGARFIIAGGGQGGRRGGGEGAGVGAGRRGGRGAAGGETPAADGAAAPAASRGQNVAPGGATPGAEGGFRRGGRRGDGTGGGNFGDGTGRRGRRGGQPGAAPAPVAN
jgi:RND family efflux transporter MFP subunit